MNSIINCKSERKSEENIVNLQILMQALEKILGYKITVKYKV